MILLTAAGYLCMVLFPAAIIALAALVVHGFDRPRDPGPNHPARRGLPEVGDDTLAMLGARSDWDG